MDALHSGWDDGRWDYLIAYGVGALIVILAVGFPNQFRRSLLRWFGDDQPARPAAEPMDAALLTGRIKRLVRPTLLLVPTTEPGFSKLGGDPELPVGLAWPRGYERPRTCLCQIDLAALPQNAIDWMPHEGRLYAFYDHDSHGLADVVRVLHSAEPAGPPAVAPKGVWRRFHERRVTFSARTSAPSFDWLGMAAHEAGLDDAAIDGLEVLADAPPSDEVQHRIGGYPNEIQPERMWLSCEHLARGLPDPVWDEEIPPAIERAAKQWRLLLQIDSDSDLKMNFGDGGRLYVFIRERDARRADFSKTVTLWQTY